ncbi:hypothetical protein [Legionella sp. WA2022007384]
MDNNYQSLREALASQKKINKQLSARIRQLERREDELKKKIRNWNPLPTLLLMT